MDFIGFVIGSLSYFFIDNFFEFLDPFGRDIVLAAGHPPHTDNILYKGRTSEKNSSFSKGITAWTSI